MSLKDVHSWKSDLRGTGNSAARAAASQRKRSRDGNSQVSAPSKIAVKLNDAHLNKSFLENYQSVPCNDSSSGASVVVVDVCELVRKIVWTRGKKVTVSK
jgi:hypothetical protein